MSKRIAIIGSTGSIGLDTLEVISAFPDRFEVVGLSAGRQAAVLADQIVRFRPQIASIADRSLVREVHESLRARGYEPQLVQLLSGRDASAELVNTAEIDLVVCALVGSVGLSPTLSAIKKGIQVAIANKEALVAAGELCISEARRSGATILPIDSEHNAIFQCLAGRQSDSVDRVVLTCSGGPLLRRKDLSAVKKEEVLAHPTWSMGPKITVDSATLMNKGLEVIEACWLFGLNPSQVKVLIHPESIIHSMVDFQNGSTMAQLAVADMKIPIAHAIAYPGDLPLCRSRLKVASIDLADMGSLSFEEPDTERFPALDLAYEAIKIGGTAPAAMNAANEIAVDAFLEGRISFPKISSLGAAILEDHEVGPADNIDAVLAADRWARMRALEEL